MTAEQPQKDYTVKQVADLLQINEDTVYLMVRRGDLGAYYVGTRQRSIRIPGAELDKYRKKNAVRPEDDSSKAA